MNTAVTSTIIPKHNIINDFDERAKRAFFPLLTQNLQLASIIMNYVKTAVPFSTNNNFRGHAFTDHLSEADFVTVLKSWEVAIGEHRNRTFHLSTEKDWREIARSIEEARVANCHGLSIVGCTYAIDMLRIKHVEIFEISDEDHCFIVLGRNPFSNERDYTTWGDACVVCDTWAESYYSASQIIPMLHNYKDVYTSNGRVLPILDPFDLRYYELSKLASIKQAEESLLPSVQSVI